MDDIEVRELRYFVAVAEELNFSRAADRLGIAQPPLSRAIRQLERRLGVQLFERDTRRVALTAAGRTMLDEARRALDVMAAVARRTRRAGATVSSLVATAKPGIASGLLQRIVAAFARLPDTPAVEIVVSGYREQADMVRDGRADVALLSSPYDERGLEAEQLVAERRVAAIPAGHALAGRVVLRCRDLDGEPMPQWAGSTADERLYWSGRDLPGAGRRAAGTEAELTGPVVQDSTELLEVVGLGQAVALIPLSLAQGSVRADIVYRPVSDASPYVIVIAWPEASRSRSLATFVGVAVDVSTGERRVTRESVVG